MPRFTPCDRKPSHSRLGPAEVPQPEGDSWQFALSPRVLLCVIHGGKEQVLVSRTGPHRWMGSLPMSSFTYTGKEGFRANVQNKPRASRTHLWKSRLSRSDRGLSLIKFFEDCKAQIESLIGETMDGFLMIDCARDTESGMPEPLAEWRRSIRVEDYTAEEMQYILLAVTTASGSTPIRCDLFTTTPTWPALPGQDPTCSP